jgi:hypothetical protein
MRLGEFLTKATIWISIAAYTIGCVVFALRRSKSEILTRLAWTLACASLIAHYIFAFQFYHSWSHTSAYVDTARQTERVFSINWGGGLFINYALLMLWIADVGWWWWAGLQSYSRRPLSLLIVWHSFFVFIIFNATVVFEDGIQRWVGLTVCLILCLSWTIIFRQRLKRVTEPSPQCVQS